MDLMNWVANIFATFFGGSLRYLANQRGELDIANYFATDEAFTVASLTQKINHVEYVPDRIGQLGIFAEDGVSSTVVIVEEEYGTIRLIPASPRGGVPEPVSRDRRKSRAFTVPHIPVIQQVMADEVQNVRAFGVGDQLSAQKAGVQEVVDKKLSLAAADLDATLEFHMAGALKGSVLDADGSTVLFNYFTEFGVSQQTQAMALTTGTTNVLGLIRAAQRASMSKLKRGVLTGWRALCGDAFFDALIGHAKVEDKYLNSADNRLLRETDLAYGAIAFGNVVWENYRNGNVLNTGASAQTYIPTDDAYLFPVGSPGLFVKYFAPADYTETVNTIGLPRYAKQEPLPMGKGIKIEAQTNPLCLCTKPAAVVKLTRV
jgi:hypothetical protein